MGVGAGLGQLKKEWLEKQLTGTPLSCADQVREYLQNRLATSRIEQVMAIYLDASLHLISSEVIAYGTVNQAYLPARDTAGAIESDACAVIWHITTRAVRVGPRRRM